VALRKWVATAAISALTITISQPAIAAEAAKPTVYTFGTLRTAPADQAKARSAEWLASIGKMDAGAFEKIWANESRSVFDRTIDSLLLGSTEAEAMLLDARNPDAMPPMSVPSIIKDVKNNDFFRANIATAYAKALSSKRVYEEALEALKSVRAEFVVEPSAFFFYKAVAEHATIQKELANGSIVRLLDDVADAPDRYKMVATLMFFDMQNWSADQKDLANIGRLMDNSGRRLDLARGGPQTQDIQKKIVFRLDEKIKELENQAKGGA
jgi:hypothetical protein